MPAGSIVEVDGLPDPWLEPMNSEARYRKYSAIRKAAQSVGWYSQAVLTAISLGAPASTYEDAAKFVQDWMDSHRLKKGAAGHV
ncbi:hypothetical protein CO683_14750 [Bradyrhizobium ottawaense]|nr:hypothetical protein CO683_14750 [Bradyrhizobium ottawaense]